MGSATQAGAADPTSQSNALEGEDNFGSAGHGHLDIVGAIANDRQTVSRLENAFAVLSPQQQGKAIEFQGNAHGAEQVS